ncbi:MAG TPA: HEAT repeat domain-containing protein [Planctomycetota bacterium]|nr:HEAT repeat domain-containing protein [Planctomycetota bacterium]
MNAGRTLLLSWIAALLAAGSSPVEGQEPGAIPPVSPGSGPTEQEGPDLTWESWWAREKGPLLDLRARLFPAPPAGADLPAGYVPLPPSERRARVRQALLEALKDRVPTVRRAAAIGLGKTRDPEALPSLLQTAKGDPDRAVRHGSLLGLGLLAAPGAVPPLRESLENLRGETTARLYSAAALGFSGGGTASLRTVFGDGGARPAAREVRIVAAYALGASGDPSVVPFLVRALARHEEGDAIVQAALVAALGRLGDASALPLVEASLAAEDPPVRAAACSALASLVPAGDPRAISRLTKLAGEDPDRYARAQALLSLGAIGGEEARSALRRALSGEEGLDTNFLSPYAGFALSLAGTAQDEPALLGAFRREREVRVRSGLSLALGLLGGPAAAAALLPEVERLGNPEVFKAASIALGLLRAGPAARPLDAVLARERRPDVLRAAAVGRGLLGDAGVLDALGERLHRENSAAMVGAIAAALGDLGDARSLDALLEALRRPGLPDSARVEVVVALGKLADPSPHPSISRLSRGTLAAVTSPTLEEILRTE